MQAFIGDFVEAGSVDFSNDLYMKIFFSGCDFKCPYCNTPDFLETKSEQVMDLKEIKREMENQKGTLEGVFLTGGEPCFQKQAIIEISKKAKELELKTVIDTNGSKTDVIENLLKNELIDTIIMDLKAPLNEQFEKITKSATFFKSSKDIMNNIKQSLEVLKSYDEKIEIIFRTTIIPSLIFRKEDLIKIAKTIEGINASWEIRPFKAEVTVDKKLQSMTRPTTVFLEDLRDSIEKEMPNLKIEMKS